MVQPLVTLLPYIPSMARIIVGSSPVASWKRFWGSSTDWRWGKAAIIMMAMSARVTTPPGLKFPSVSSKAFTETPHSA